MLRLEFLAREVRKEQSMEKEETVKKLKEELAKLTEPSKKDKALAEYEAAVKDLASLEELVQASQKRHQEALRALQLALLDKGA